ncbi:MAG: glycosyltransferase family 87 protein [Candidatus Omnitrophota bacterium]|nr:glycosyltransferase family 87 protein [Candidatus Omnitrophota bacterium]
MAHRRVISFTNPPIVLFIFRPFAKVDYSLLFNVYLILKCVLLTGLIYIWRNVFLNKQAGLMFYVLCVFGFNAAIYLDLRAGNINMFEQCLLWLAFFYYLKHKLIRFCVLLITASIFKLQPMLFIFLLLFAQDKNKYKLLLLSLAVFIAILLMQYLYDPRLFSHFIAGFVAFSGLERGIINPSTSALLRDLVDLLLKIKDRNLLNVVSTIAYGIAIIPIIVISLLALARLKSADIKDKEKWAVLFSCSLYAVVANYFKDWSYILLIVPAYFIIKTTRISPKGLLLFIACLCVINVHLPGAAAVNNLFWNYYPLFVAYLVWYLYLNELRTTS